MSCLLLDPTALNMLIFFVINLIIATNADVIRLVSLAARQSGTYGNNWASMGVDGNNYTCSIACTTCQNDFNGDTRSAWFQIDLGEIYEVYQVALISNYDDTNARYLENFAVSISNNNSTTAVQWNEDQCGEYNNPNVARGTLIMINCTKPTRGQYMTFIRRGGYRQDAFSTCEVFAWGERVQQGAPGTSTQHRFFITTNFNESDGLTREEIIGISLGAIFGFFLLILTFFLILFFIYCYRRGKMADKKTEVIQSNPDSESINSKVLTIQTSMRSDEFYQHVKLLRDENSKGFLQLFMNLPEDEVHPTEIALNKFNQCKNRFQNVLPYDNNRVLISGISSDYINASHIKGFNGRDKYIATQDPIDVTIVDFWLMIWQNKIGRIVSLSACSRFWPELKENYGFVSVTMVTEERYANHCKRLLALETVDGSHEVVQFEYTEDNFLSTPFHFLPFITLVRNSGSGGDPLVVHCSGGIGPTGCYIAIDYLLDELESRDQVGLVTCVERLRHQRMNSVQTLEQFIFVHDVIVEKIRLGRMLLTGSKLLEKLERIIRLKTRGKLELDRRYQVLEEFINDHAERYGNGSPLNHPDVYVNSYKKKNAYWLRKVPDVSQFDVFWKSLFEVKVDICVAVGTNIKNFWPIEMNVEHYYDVIGVTCKEMICSASDVIKTSRFELTNYSEVNKTSYNLIIMHLDHDLPYTTSDLFYDNACASHVVDLYKKINFKNSNSSISFVSVDGTTHCGLLATAFYLLDTLKIERVADVTRACRYVTSVQPRAISSSTQYKFLHQVLLNFLKRNSNDGHPLSWNNEGYVDDDVNVVTFDPIGSSFI